MAEEKETTGGEEKGASGVIDILAGILKTSPIETRKELGRIIRTDADIWNAINGVGKYEGENIKGSMEGIVKSGGTLLSGVTVAARQDGAVVDSTTSDANGKYRIDLFGGSYDFEFSKQDYHTENKDSEPIFPGVELTKNIELVSAV